MLGSQGGFVKYPIPHKDLFDDRHRELMRRLKLLPIFRCGYCHRPHPTRFCPEYEEAWQ